MSVLTTTSTALDNFTDGTDHLNSPISFLPSAPARPTIARKVFRLPTQEYQFFSKYAQWRENDKRRETWPEGAARVVNFFQEEVGIDKLSKFEWDELEQALLALDATSAMRVLQMAGPALKRCHVGVYNCSYAPADCLFSFAELLYILMQGTGGGFSVTRSDVSKLPTIKLQDPNVEVPTIVIPDSTEGWCNALYAGLQSWFDGHDVTFDYSAIRPAGARLKTKGGRASGPDPLRHLLEFTREKVFARQGFQLRTIDVHDINCMIGQIVQVGGVRRAAEISLFDASDPEMLHCKDWPAVDSNRQRYMANNSAIYESKPTWNDFQVMWQTLATSGTGEPGLFNRYAANKSMPERRKRHEGIGTNPCGEILLRPHQFCNLSIAVARAWDTEKSLKNKVRIATIFGTLQACLTNFTYIRPIWADNCEEERLLGVDITGQMDCPLLRPNNPNRDVLLDQLMRVVKETNIEYAERLGIPASAALTCVKPSGNSAQLFGCCSGIHGWRSPFMIRRFRAGRTDPLSSMMIDQGVPWQPVVGPEETASTSAVICFEFPVKAPEGAFTTEHMNEIETLENWLTWKTRWAEHSVSQTVYVKNDKWDEVGQWVFDHWDQVTGLSFFPKDDSVYELAPEEPITKERYEELSSSFPVIDYGQLKHYETEDTTTGSREFACTGDRCEVL